MGQIASFFGINEAVFQRLAAYPASFDFDSDAIASEGFNQSFEGLRYMLSKGREPAVIELVDRLFYPANFVGEEIDYENLDFANLPDDFDFEGKAIYYNGPSEVKKINTFLTIVTENEFVALFDPDELNRAGVYPGVWNRETAENKAFNERDIVQEFSSLKRFFEHIAEENAYCLVFIG